MDYFQGVVTEYLRANRCTFINPEFTLQLDDPLITPYGLKDRYWIIDILTVSFEKRTVYLGEVTYSKTMGALIRKLGQLAKNWAEIKSAVHRDTKIPDDWNMQVWCFVKESNATILKSKKPPLLPEMRITPLEDTLPWKFVTWNKPDSLQ